ncbi:MAG: DUF2798 domain-containing protein [Pseudomonadota bacterium]
MRDPQRFVFPVVMATMMSFLMSALITAINLGITGRFLSDWMGAWSLSGPIAVAGVLATRPLAERVTAAIVALIPRRTAQNG